MALVASGGHTAIYACRAPFEIEDEFCQEAEENATVNRTMKSEFVTSVTCPPAAATKTAATREDEEGDSAFSATPSPVRDDEEGQLEEVKVEEVPLDPLTQFIPSGQAIPKTCRVLTAPNGNRMYLVGTAHFPPASNEEVMEVIRQVRPDTVMLELCGARTEILRLDTETVLKQAERMDVGMMKTIFRQYGYVQGALYLMMLTMSAKLTKVRVFL